MSFFIVLILASTIHGGLPTEVIDGWKAWETRLSKSQIVWQTTEFEENKPTVQRVSNFKATLDGQTFALEAFAGGQKKFDSVVAVNDEYSFRIQRKPGGLWSIDKFAPPSLSVRQMAMQEMMIIVAPYFIPTSTDSDVDSLLKQKWTISSVREEDKSLVVEFSTDVNLEKPINGATSRAFAGAMHLAKEHSFGITKLEGTLAVGDGKQLLKFPWEINVEYDGKGTFGFRSVKSARGIKPARYMQNVNFEKFELPMASAKKTYLEAYGLSAPTSVTTMSNTSYFWPVFVILVTFCCCSVIWLWRKGTRSAT
jgi:hypothetical protein